MPQNSVRKHIRTYLRSKGPSPPSLGAEEASSPSTIRSEAEPGSDCLAGGRFGVDFRRTSFYSANHSDHICYTSDRFCFVGTLCLRGLPHERLHECAYHSSPRVLSKLDTRKQPCSNFLRITRKCMLVAFFFVFFFLRRLGKNKL